MKLILPLFFLCVLVVNGSAQVKKFATAVEYNDFIIAEQVKIGKVIKDFNALFGHTGDSIAIHKARVAIISQANSSVKLVTRGEPFDGDKNFKQAAVSLFSFYSSAAQNEYKQLVQVSFNKKKSYEDVKKDMDVIIKALVAKETLYDKTFDDAQKAFAAKHHINLRENEFKPKG